MVFEEVVTDDEILEAVNECLKEAIVPTDCIVENLKAKNLGIGVRRLRERLFLLEKDGKISSKKIGTGLGYRPVDSQ